MKLNKKQGFTLIEMIVVIAVTGIFFTISGLILSSSFNMFGKNRDQSGNFSDTVLTENVIHKFMTKINNDRLGVSVIGNVISSNGGKYKISIEEEKIVYEYTDEYGVTNTDEYEYSMITIVIKKINNNSIQVNFIEKKSNDKARENIYYVIGGVN